MNKVAVVCIRILKIFMAIALLLILIESIRRAFEGVFDEFSSNLLYVIFWGIFTGTVIIVSKISTKAKIWSLLFLTFILRMWWILSVNSVPVSDFKSMYEAANELLNGNTSTFRNYGYLSRFPHLVFMTVYMAFFIALFPIGHLFMLQMANAFFGVLAVRVLYSLSGHFIKSEKIRLIIMLMGVVFPPFIVYSSTFCTENIAIPLYILTMFLFFEANSNNSIYICGSCGVLLTISNLFRGVAIVFLVAFLIYIFVFGTNNKFRNALWITLSFLFSTIAISLLLMSVGIIDKPLWKGDEPSYATLLLKGSNVEYDGRWNLEDSNFVDQNIKDPNLSKKCIDLSFQRISKLSFSERFNFYFKKFIAQWTVGDCGGTYWAFLDAKVNPPSYILIPFQLMYILIIILCIVSLVRKLALKKTLKNVTRSSALIYILLCGFGLMFIIIETQPRYAYVISWVFIILAAQGIETILEFFTKKQNIVKKPK